MQQWKATQNKHGVIDVRIPYETRNGFTFKVLLTSDRHHDNPKSDNAMEKRHLEEAKAINAPVFDIGDLFCAMQGRNDRRGHKSGVKPQDSVDSYYTQIVESAAEFYGPYASQFAMIGTGNHESAVLNRNEIDLTGLLLKFIELQTGVKINRGGYAGFTRFCFERPGGGTTIVKTMFHTHGSGGSSPVTGGVLQSARRAVWNPDADICISGHIHSEYRRLLRRFRLDKSGTPYFDEQLHVSIPTYKDEFDVKGGWHMEKTESPRPIGASWLIFTYRNSDIHLDTILAR
jgi:hypothetical protein